MARGVLRVKAAWVDNDELQRSLVIEEARSILLSFHEEVLRSTREKLLRSDLSQLDIMNELRFAIVLASLRGSPDEVLVLTAQLHDIQSGQ